MRKCVLAGDFEPIKFLTQSWTVFKNLICFL